MTPSGPRRVLSRLSRARRRFLWACDSYFGTSSWGTYPAFTLFSLRHVPSGLSEPGMTMYPPCALAGSAILLLCAPAPLSLSHATHHTAAKRQRHLCRRPPRPRQTQNETSSSSSSLLSSPLSRRLWRTVVWHRDSSALPLSVCRCRGGFPSLSRGVGRAGRDGERMTRRDRRGTRRGDRKRETRRAWTANK